MHFAAIDKIFAESIQNCTLNESKQFKDYDYSKNIFDFGCNNKQVLKLVKQNAIPLFKNPNTQDYFDEYNLYICSKETFLAVIDCLREQIVDYYREILNDENELKTACQSKIHAWQPISLTLGIEPEKQTERTKQVDVEHYPYNLDMSRDLLVSSWLNEYRIFELVRQYRNFDWENNSLLFFGC